MLQISWNIFNFHYYFEIIAVFNRSAASQKFFKVYFYIIGFLAILYTLCLKTITEKTVGEARDTKKVNTHLDMNLGCLVIACFRP